MGKIENTDKKGTRGMKIRIKNQKNEQNIWGRFNSETKIAKENQGR